MSILDVLKENHQDALAAMLEKSAPEDRAALEKQLAVIHWDE